jgi:CheY-like chemotaxis protein
MTIIVIDDNPEARALTVRILAKAGYKTQSGGTAAAALDFARNVRDIALILLDIHMPGGTGFDALQILKADPYLKDIPVLMLSATIDVRNERERAQRMGAVNLLGYPIADRDLLDAVKNAVGRRKGATDTPLE